MANEIISYLEMCQREGTNLQRGMNYRLGGSYSVILMSTRYNSPYQDLVEDDGRTLVYEGHDSPRTTEIPDPKLADQPQVTSAGNLTENGKFYRAAQEHKLNGAEPEGVRVYEKIRQGIWSYNGLFQLVDSWVESDGVRNVFKFKLITTDDASSQDHVALQKAESGRVIPTAVKLEVWKRDRGRCTVCGATDDLHFDHIIPYSKGGTSLMADNIQILCARHNLEKGDKIL